ncbi:trehalose operon repressor [Enterococcus sp. 10A9_DIV0425]|uniref:Trehalose operon repressor n=1 Tax=Candidatus Enterococcus wittei TaxID=1987383 RepID=A0A242JXY3_9ENTE|nr:UTRA domain-containing protein [Enterococcus sp. 10A9_DIV0425]OTP10176.1 trehalose operon repressor [Enterococcus sp. 10A9_DIV0425]
MKKYKDISNQILERIHKGLYLPETFLPSERKLMTEFNVARQTIRSALKDLEQNGYIEKLPAKGSKVIPHDKINFFVSDLSGTSEKYHFTDHQLKTEILQLKKIDVDEKLRENSGFSLGETVWYLIRKRSLNEQAVILEFDYLRLSIVPTLTEEILIQSLYHYLEQNLQLKLHCSKKEISVENIELPVAQHLTHDHRDKNMIVVRNWAYLNDYTQFQYTESWHQVDSFKFVLLADRPLH